MKRWVKWMSLSFIVLGAAGCSNEDEGSAGKSISLALWDENASEAVDGGIAAFKEKHPDVEVNVTYSPFSQYWTTLRTSIGGGAGPDLFWMNAVNFYQYAEPGLIKNLEPFLESDPDFEKSDYYESMIELYSFEDDLYGAPYFVDAIGLYYNKEIFDQAGVAYPDETWTWADIERVGEELTNPEEGIYGYLAPVVHNQSGYYNYIHQAGGEIVSEDQLRSGFHTDAAKEAFSFIERLIDKGISPGIKSQIQNDNNQLFMSNQLAMMPAISVMGVTYYEELGDKVDVAPLPSHKEEASILHGISWAMNQEVDDPDLAWELMKELTSAQGNEIIAETGFSTPAARSAADLWLDSLPGMNLQVFIDAQEFGAAYPLSRNTAEWQRMETTEIQGAFLSGEPIEDVLDRVGAEMERILSQGQDEQ
ncbi:multiple sugar transport system substrate-binding protein [Alkalihalobacillus xiaoxiensis]|uniref:Multiple sugar transport system substrate-binding protein n=1 Tax=Shouchella xiaoxiensis TaxID=766895 RepID=A0ABS2SPL4_9BACI|nr:sugar ABC transporter substrate-binding protein [Shouchella xiaoxiensis]MBM7837106.1 multiple sugar transport system substrate-binding protein [Shouchella xiaoxiensis]